MEGDGDGGTSVVRDGDRGAVLGVGDCRAFVVEEETMRRTPLADGVVLLLQLVVGGSNERDIVGKRCVGDVERAQLVSRMLLQFTEQWVDIESEESWAGGDSLVDAGMDGYGGAESPYGAHFGGGVSVELREIGYEALEAMDGQSTFDECMVEGIKGLGEIRQSNEEVLVVDLGIVYDRSEDGQVASGRVVSAEAKLGICKQMVCGAEGGQAMVDQSVDDLGERRCQADGSVAGWEEGRALALVDHYHFCSDEIGW